MMTEINNSLKKLPFDSKIRAESALSAILNVDLMIEDFKNRKAESKADILLDVYGLLQGLFVGIDGLYQLSISTTKYKYHININSNRILKQLKYIRNDIVGHPTNRNYDDGTFGFSIILDNEITKDALSYVTYIIKGKEIHKEKHTLYFNDVINAYVKEKTNFLNDLENHLKRQPSSVETIGLLVELFDKAQKNQFNVQDLAKIKVQFMKEQNLKVGSGNRFLWRLELLSKLFVWKDESYQTVVNYSILKQVLTIYQMNLDLNDQKLRIPKVESPKIIMDFKRFVNQNGNARKLIINLNDHDHPLFNTDLNSLIYLVKDENTKKFLEWFKNLRDLDHSFLIGKILKDILNEI